MADNNDRPKRGTYTTTVTVSRLELCQIAGDIGNSRKALRECQMYTWTSGEAPDAMLETLDAILRTCVIALANMHGISATDDCEDADVVVEELPF